MASTQPFTLTDVASFVSTNTSILQPMEVASLIQAFAALITCLAAIIALWVTSKAPERAVRIAENLRVNSDHAAFRQSEKYRIFRTLMEYRGRNISDPEPVNAINMIDLVFHEDQRVREALSNFLLYINGAHNAENRMSSYMRLLAEIAKSLGFPANITARDIDRGYYPISS